MTQKRVYESIVGTKGEIFLKKEIRERMGLKPSVSILIYEEEDQIIIRKKKEFRDLIANAKIRYFMSKEEEEAIDREINEGLER